MDFLNPIKNNYIGTYIDHSPPFPHRIPIDMADPGDGATIIAPNSKTEKRILRQLEKIRLEGRKARAKKLPNKLIAVPNADKSFHEQWGKGRNPLNLPHPFRGVVLGQPNCGKTTLVKNIILRAKPKFERVVVIHCDPDYTQEYDDVGAEMIANIPKPQDWEGDVKTLVVLDDLEYKGMPKEERRALDRLFGFVSTHKNISCLLCAQDPFNVPPIVRRCSNLWVLWKMADTDSLATIGRRVGMKPQAFKDIFDNILTEPRDSLWIDSTPGTPYPMRKNGFEVIEPEDDEDNPRRGV